MAELYQDQGVFYSTDPSGNERALQDFLPLPGPLLYHISHIRQWGEP